MLIPLASCLILSAKPNLPHAQQHLTQSCVYLKFMLLCNIWGWMVWVMAHQSDVWGGVGTNIHMDTRMNWLRVYGQRSKFEVREITAMIFLLHFADIYLNKHLCKLQLYRQIKAILCVYSKSWNCLTIEFTAWMYIFYGKSEDMPVQLWSLLHWI